MKELFRALISSTHGNGPSLTRLVYLVNGLVAVFCALMMTTGGMIVYCVSRQANSGYWTGVAALWTATLGFGAKTKNEQGKAAKEIALAPHQNAMVAAVSGD